MTITPNPDLDLVLERTADVSPAFVWDAWTKSELLKRWFCPKPWQTVEAEIDLRPGGIFRTVIEGPNGERFDNAGCWLEVVPMSRLVWTGALTAGWRPQAITPEVPFMMTAIVTFDPTPSGGTRYVATVLHADAKGRAAHEAMGFPHGWSLAFDQLVAMASKG